jgi:RNA polymerase sigma factor (sigma-70 family)
MMGARVEAIEHVYRTRYVSFRNALTAVTGDREAARDAVQEAFARALAGRRRFRGEGSLEAWIWRIALRTALESRHQPGHLPLEDQMYPQLAGPDSDPELADAVRTLPQRRRLIFFLRYVADLAYVDIARICGVSEGTVAAALSQAREQVARELDRREASARLTAEKGFSHG